MQRKNPIFYNALLLTGVNLLLRLAGTSFQVFLSGRIGPAGIGLLQLVLSVGSLAVVAGMGGIRTATMYLTAEELGHKQDRNIGRVLSACFLYSILCSGCIAVILYICAPWICEYWIGEIRTLGALQLYAAFLPVICLCGVMTGYFTAANRIRTLAFIEVWEQVCSMAITILTLTFWAGEDPGRACLSVILGSCIGCCLTLVSLVILRIREKTGIGRKIPVASRLADAAVPLAIADVVKAGINTTENLMVPKQLAKHPFTNNSMAAFGTINGMVFPLLMFPACILFGLAELLIPELARCAAAGSKERISYLVRKGLRVSMLYGMFFCGLMFLLAQELCVRLYNSAEAGQYLQLYTLLIPMLYCDAIIDAMVKGLGQQKICVRYNIVTSLLDVVFLYFLLPGYGMQGYFISFFLTHLLNFLLSLRRLLKITDEHIPFAVPAFSTAALLAAIWGASGFIRVEMRVFSFIALLGSLLYLLKIVTREDIAWIVGLIRKK